MLNSALSGDGAETVVIEITGVHGNFYSDPCFFFLTARSNRIKELYKYKTVQYPYLAITFKCSEEGH